MAQAKPKPRTAADKATPRPRPIRWLWRRVRWVIYGPVLLFLFVVLLFRWVNPPMTHTIWVERARLGAVKQDWVPIDGISPHIARSIVAAEDANFCLHWGFDLEAIRLALDEGAVRGASTITQQTVKNVFLWQDRSWLRKALEAVMTPVVEALWSKKRILEVYLNVAEFGEGVFGVDAASFQNFGVGPSRLSAMQAAQLATVLPNPKERSAAKLSSALQRRARSIADGAATIAADGRAACFED